MDVPADVRDLANPGSARIEALSDGIFAIAMTLLAFNLKVPESVASATSSQDLAGSLRSELSVFATFFFSFITLGMFWISHHNIFIAIRQADRPMLLLNINLLLLVAAVPFTTNLINAYPDNRLAIFIFGGNLIIISAMLFLTWSRAERKGFLEPWVSPAYSRLAKLRTTYIPLVALGSIALSFVNPSASMYVYLLLLPMYAAPGYSQRVTEHVLASGEIPPFMGARRSAPAAPKFKPFGDRRPSAVTETAAQSSE